MYHKLHSKVLSVDADRLKCAYVDQNLYDFIVMFCRKPISGNKIKTYCNEQERYAKIFTYIHIYYSYII